SYLPRTATVALSDAKLRSPLCQFPLWHAAPEPSLFIATNLKVPATAARAKPVFVLAHECLPPIPAVEIRRMLPESVAKAGPTLFSGCAPAAQTGFEPAPPSSAAI